ncbi:Nitrogen permease regulator-like 3 [Tyrophagus putrescentiae]|nr:Nitrogen permease regulator-like 3 [Tyrophagus putrescentiae]
MSSTVTTSSTAMAPAGQSDETIPLGVFLVKSDCNGEKLLFRFPYTTVKSELGSSKSHNASGGTNSSKPSKRATSADQEDPGGAALLPSFAELISSSNLLTLDANDQDEISKVIGITDSTFSTLFGVLKSKLCGMKFELKVDNVRFVGHPSTLTAFGATEESAVLDVCFHVVFALKANAPADVVHCYHDLSKRIATALISEEARCGYFSKETKIMGRCHDEIATTLAIADRDGIAASKVGGEGADPSLAGDASLPASLPYSSILERSHLAKSLQTVFRQLLNDGLVQVRINSLVNIHFCLPQKVHRKLLMAPTVMTPLTPSSSSSSSSATPSASSITTTTTKLPLITPESINKCLCGLRPYHTFLLLVSTAELMDFLPPDVSSPVVCLVKMASPLKNLIELSADAGISLSQTFNVVAQLVYWGKATIIFPICETNLYVLHPNANTDLHSPLAAQFEARFGKANATNASSTAANAANSADANAPAPADFVPVNTSADPLLPNAAQPNGHAEQAREWVQVLEWLLQKRLLMQLHTYVVFFPLGQGPKPYIHCNASTSNNGSHQQHPRRMSFTQVSTSRPPSSSTTGGGGDLAGDYCSTIASSSYHSESSLFGGLGGSLSPSADHFDYFGSNQSTVTAGSSASMFRAGGGGRVHTTSMTETGGGVGGSLNGSSKANGGGGGGTELSQLESAEMILRESDLLLSPKEMAAVLAVCATKSFEDIRLFARLCPVYFDGHHHVEDMMHYENLRRSQILTLVEKFQELLLVYTYEDTTVDTLQPYNTL